MIKTCTENTEIKTAGEQEYNDIIRDMNTNIVGVIYCRVGLYVSPALRGVTQFFSC